MSDIYEGYAEQRERSVEKRARNRETSAEALTRAGIFFRSYNNGAHLKTVDFDFWPGTGLFINQKTGARGRGVFNLIKLLKK